MARISQIILVYSLTYFSFRLFWPFCLRPPDSERPDAEETPNTDRLLAYRYGNSSSFSFGDLYHVVSFRLFWPLDIQTPNAPSLYELRKHFVFLRECSEILEKAPGNWPRYVLSFKTLTSRDSGLKHSIPVTRCLHL